MQKSIESRNNCVHGNDKYTANLEKSFLQVEMISTEEMNLKCDEKYISGEFLLQYLVFQKSSKR